MPAWLPEVLAIVVVAAGQALGGVLARWRHLETLEAVRAEIEKGLKPHADRVVELEGRIARLERRVAAAGGNS